MKRILSVLLASLLVLTMAVVLVVPASAEFEGDWTTSRSGNDYDEEADSHAPEPGYHYDPAVGFVVDSPDYIKTPFMQAHTKNPVNLKTPNGDGDYSVSLKFTVLDYAYNGEEGANVDQWIALTLNSQPRSCPGNVNYGEGLCILIRRNVAGNDLGEGKAQVETFYVDKTGGKNFALITGNGFGLVQTDVPVNDKGQEEYTFTVSYNAETGYNFQVNDVVFGGDEYLNNILDTVCADGAYVSVLMQTGVVASKASIAITEWQGNLPVGDDSKAPEEDMREVAEIADSANVPANEPAVLWGATCRDHRLVELAGALSEVTENGTVKSVIQTNSPYVSFGVKSAVSYEAKDFPIVAVLTKNCWANQGNCYFMAGNHLNASEEYKETWTIDDVAYTDGWALGFIDLSYYTELEDDGWVGRINGVRVGFEYNAEDVGDEEYGTFEIGFIGAFRSVEEAKAYADAFVTAQGVDPDATTEEPTTEAPTDPEPDESTDDVTTAPESEEQTTEAPKKSSCGSIVALPAVALVAVLGVAFVAKKKD